MFNEPTLESVNKGLQDANKKIADLETGQKKLEDAPYLDRNLDNQSKDILAQEIAAKALDIVWNEFLYVIPTLVDFTRYRQVPSGSGSAVINEDGLYLSTGATSGSSQVVSLRVGTDDSVISRVKETRFRAMVSISSVADVEANVGTMGELGNNACGFRFLNGSLYGWCDNGTTETMTLLQTYAADTVYDLQLYLFPRSGIKFFVNSIEKGSISTNMPISGGTLERAILMTTIANTAAADKIMTVALAEFIQRKK